jgi:hypothetical protein
MTRTTHKSFSQTRLDIEHVNPTLTLCQRPPATLASQDFAENLGNLKPNVTMDEGRKCQRNRRSLSRWHGSWHPKHSNIQLLLQLDLLRSSVAAEEQVLDVELGTRTTLKPAKAGYIYPSRIQDFVG